MPWQRHNVGSFQYVGLKDTVALPYEIRLRCTSEQADVTQVPALRKEFVHCPVFRARAERIYVGIEYRYWHNTVPADSHLVVPILFWSKNVMDIGVNGLIPDVEIVAKPGSYGTKPRLSGVAPTDSRGVLRFSFESLGAFGEFEILATCDAISNSTTITIEELKP